MHTIRTSAGPFTIPSKIWVRALKGLQIGLRLLISSPLLTLRLHTEVTLDKRDRELIRNIQKGRFADPEFDPYEVFGDPGPVSIHPMLNLDEPKRRFIPSKWEAQRVNYLVQAIKKGWIKTGTYATSLYSIFILCYIMFCAMSTENGTYLRLSRQGALPKAEAEALPYMGPG